MPPLLAISDLAISFDGMKGAAQAVKGISLTLFPGQTLAVVGESGCGKSVTALSIMGLLPFSARIERGSIHFNERDLLTCNARTWRAMRGRDIAMIFQEPMTSLNPVYTIGDQLLEAIRINGVVNNHAAKTRAIDALHEVGINNPAQRLSQFPHELSGGMRQRVMIAMALAGHPKLLLADEPTTALDVTIQAQLLSLMKNLQRSRGMAILLITHDLGVVAQNADVACVMYAGRVVEYAAVEALFARPLHPYTRALLECRPQLGEVKARLATVSQLMLDAGRNALGSAAGSNWTPWWPADEHHAEYSREHRLIEVEPEHWVGCWMPHSADVQRVPEIAPNSD